jgi:hypothetical protein
MSEEADRPIGWATMWDDGTLVLDLRPEGPGGIRGVARILRPPSHPRYRAWIEHLGGMTPGQQKLVAPWPSQPQEPPRVS